MSVIEILLTPHFHISFIILYYLYYYIIILFARVESTNWKVCYIDSKTEIKVFLMWQAASVIWSSIILIYL